MTGPTPLLAALKCWLQEMLATEIGLALSRRRDGVAAAMLRRCHGDAAGPLQQRRGVAAAWPRRGQDFRDTVTDLV